MQYVTLPGTDLRVSNISLGTVPFGTSVSRENAFALLDTYTALGGTLVDTAHVYADWHGGERHMSEKTIGQWLKQTGRRNEIVLVTKGGHPDMATHLTPRLAPDQIIADLDESLACLGVEQIDLYFLHRDDPARPVDEIMETLNAQAQLGKIRYYGGSNWQPARIRAAQAYAAAHQLRPLAASQPFWSLAVPNPGAFGSDHALMDDAMRAFYVETGLAVMAFTAQARGFFTKAAASSVDALKPERRQAFENAETLARLGRAQTLAQQLNTSVTAIVLAYIYSQPFVSIPIIGPNTLDQLHDSLAHSDLTLTPAMVHYLQTGEEGAN